jgi:Zn-dependent alcohol dehydrogenase
MFTTRFLTTRATSTSTSTSKLIKNFSSFVTQAAVCSELGQPLQYLDWTLASPVKNQLKVEVVAAGINFADVLQVQGLYQEKMNPPFVSGMECAGE